MNLLGQGRHPCMLRLYYPIGARRRVHRPCDQLDVLDAALTAAKEGTATAVYVHGPSGIGKSALLEWFLDRAMDREEVIVLRGRCYEHESVPYKGFDGVIDSLSQFLSGMPGHKPNL